MTYKKYNVADNAYWILWGDITSTDTTIPLSEAYNLPNSNYVASLIHRNSDWQVEKQEKVYISATNGSNLTAQRWYDWTTAQSFNAGDSLQLLIEQEIIRDLQRWIDLKANLDWGNSFTGVQLVDWNVWISWEFWVGYPGAIWWIINIWEAGVWSYRSAYIYQDQSWYMVINNQQNNYIELQTNNGANKIRFDENWNVWIWTTTPWDKLDVNWQYWRITYNTSSNMWLKLQNSWTWWSQISFRNSNWDEKFAITYDQGNSKALFQNWSSNFMARDLSNGNVWIWTTTPWSKLSIVWLPTSSDWLNSWDIWNDNGTLKIV